MSSRLLQQLGEEAVKSAIHDVVLEAYPSEGCGFVFEDRHGRLRVVPTRNLAGGRDTFEADLTPILDAERQGRRLRVIFHSHPDGSADFSEADRAEALIDGDDGEVMERYPGVVHMVLAVCGPQRKVKDVRMYRWVGERFEEV